MIGLGKVNKQWARLTEDGDKEGGNGDDYNGFGDNDTGDGRAIFPLIQMFNKQPWNGDQDCCIPDTRCIPR